MIKTTKKLIEVALPLEAINDEGSRRKRKAPAGYPTTLHKWWAQRPVAAARAVIFAQMVDDPSEYVDTLLSVTETRRAAERALKDRRKIWEGRKAEYEAANNAERAELPEPGSAPTLEDCAADVERLRLFRIIEDLVKWDNTNNELVFERGRDEIWQSWRRTCAANADHPRAKQLFNRDKLPAFYDPFAGSGAIPLEAQRLGLETYASDLNPVAVLITKGMIEIPPRFGGRPPVNPNRDPHRHWKGAQGIADDVRYYGRWMRDEAERRIGHLYPRLEVTAEMAAARPDLNSLVGQELNVVAWLWARTVRSPNPAFGDVHVPLVTSFVLSSKPGKQVYLEPIVQGSKYDFKVHVGTPPTTASAGTKLSHNAFKCLLSGVPIPYEYIDDEANQGRVGARLLAIVVNGQSGRLYLDGTQEQETSALQATPAWKPDLATRGTWASNAQGRKYGFRTFGDYFTNRQLVTLSTFSDLVREVRQHVRRDALAGAMSEDGEPIEKGGSGARAYADAVALFLAFGVSRLADYGSSLATWRPKDNAMRSTMPKQAIQMSWDYAEGAPFGGSSSGFTECVEVVAKVLETALNSTSRGEARQLSAQSGVWEETKGQLICTDPPYYNNIGYADLADFFYVWLRPTLQDAFPSILTTLTVPKAEELVACHYRHGGKEAAEGFFLEGMTEAMHRLAENAHPALPVAIYYAYRQTEKKNEQEAVRTGWETFLSAVIQAGFSITGTWPIHTEGDNRQVGIDSNALASSIVLVCRQRPSDAPVATRRQFIDALRTELPVALGRLQRGNIAPVDLAQASIGPGMAVLTRYEKVVDAEGRKLSVGDALELINDALDEVLAEQEGDFDADSRWALAWFEQNGFADGDFGVAEILSKAKNTSIGGLAEAGILESRRGKVRLLRPEELPPSWDPATDSRLTAWEVVHHLVRVQNAGGENAAAQLVAKLANKADVARELAYRLYTICERKKRATEALAYNALVQSWPEITRLAQAIESKVAPTQTEMFGGN